MLYRGADATGTSLGVGRPLGIMADGTVLALTDTALIALVPGGQVTILPTSPDLVGGVNSNGTMVAVKNAVSHAVDVYTLTPKSFQTTYVTTVRVDPLALAWTSSDTLDVIGADGAVSSYNISNNSSSLIASSSLPTPWP
jgi:hypothetical protein